MYKMLLASRYLRTRFIALASVVSVMLGVATMIVVNGVMSGFSAQMRDRIHGILADIMVDSISTDGEADPQGLIDQILAIAGDDIAAITPTVEIYGMMSFKFMGQDVNRPVTLIGIVPEGKDLVSPLRQYLRSRQSFRDEAGDHPAARRLDEPLDWELSPAALEYRKQLAEFEEFRGRQGLTATAYAGDEELDWGDNDPSALEGDNPFADSPSSAGPPVDPLEPQPARLYVGEGLVSIPRRDRKGEAYIEHLILPGQDVNITTIKAGRPEPVSFKATVVDLFKSGMSEYDSTFVFCSLEHLQKFRGMVSPPAEPGPDADDAARAAWLQSYEDWSANRNLDWRQGRVTSLQIRLHDERTAPDVLERLQRGLDFATFHPRTWEEKQGALLEAVKVEAAILNVLLFLIITVAGFGILAIFYMIVVEKMRDIGILKALGASSRGVMAIFLSYGLALGLVGSGVGVVLGLLFIRYINEVEAAVSWMLGQKVFDETIYYFHEIPTAVHPMMVIWVALGAVIIAVLASVLPARQAAGLRPVEALRFE